MSTKCELIEIDRVLSRVAITKAQSREWKHKPLEEERRALIVEVDTVLISEVDGKMFRGY